MLTPDQISELKENIYKNVDLGINRYTQQMNIIRYANGYIRNIFDMHVCMCDVYKYSRETKTYTFKLIYIIPSHTTYFDISIRKFKLIKIFEND